MAAEFVHLHVHSQYSFLTSAVKLSDLPGKAKALGMSGVALTDVANMYGAIRHYKGCKDKGLTPILGCAVFIPRSNRTGALDHLVLLAENTRATRTWCASCRRGTCARPTTTRPP
jgi:DNA polymerase-3 subunit alpha